MAAIIWTVAATGANLRSEDALEEIAQRFLEWIRDYPPDVGLRVCSGGRSGHFKAVARQTASASTTAELQ